VKIDSGTHKGMHSILILKLGVTLLISLGFLVYVEHWDFVGNPYGVPLNRAAYLHSRLNIKYICSTWACTIFFVATSFLFHFMTVATLGLALALTLRGCDLEYFKPYVEFPLLMSMLLYILIQ
jgi:hypothetical protein